MSNTLFPIFLKTEEVHFLIIGGGNVGLEKAETLLRQNDDIRISIVAKEFHPDLLKIIDTHPKVFAYKKPYEKADLDGKDFVIIGTDDSATNQKARNDAKNLGIKVNAADMPELCDFYLGSIVKKGDLKIAISTNGKSPTIAKRLRETLDESLPDELEDLIANINQLRTHLSGDFKEKVKILNAITQELSKDPQSIEKYTNK